MRSRTIVIAMLLVLCATVLITAQNASDLYRQALAREQVGDCEGAIPIYERIVRSFTTNKDREQIATAKLHLGECWIKRTEADQTKGLDYLNDVATNYPELKLLVSEANRLKTLISTAADPGKPVEIATPFTEDVFSFAISPNGLTLVQQVTTDGKKQLWLQPVDPSKKPTPIAGTEGAGRYALPFFSPDGKYIGFFAGGKLKTISVNGGIPQDLADLSSFRGGTWNKDNIIVYGLGGALHRIRSDGTDGRAVTALFGNSEVIPKFLADGFRFLFVANLSRPTLVLGAIDNRPHVNIQPIDAEAAVFSAPDRMVYVVGGALLAQRLDAMNEKTVGDPIRLAERVALSKNWPVGIAALSVSDSGPVAYRVDAAAKKQFRLVDRKGSLIRNVGPADALNPSSARISRDGKFVTFHRSSGTTVVGDMWTMDIKDGVPGPLLNGANSAVWSPNTEHGMFAELVSKSVQMDLFDRLGPIVNQKHIGKVGDVLSVDDWSSKNYILYERSRDVVNPPDLIALPLDGGEPVAVAQTSFGERNGRFSPDGAWVAYQSNELGARDEVFVQRFPASANSRKRVSINGGTLPHWSFDGQQLYFLSADNHLMSVPITRSADGQEIVLEKAASLFLLKPGSEFEVAADNKFLINEPERAPSIFVLSNWVNKLPAVNINSTSSPLVVSNTASTLGRPTGYNTQNQIVVVDRQQKVLSTVKDTGPDPRLSISPDGAQVAFLNRGNIWVVDIASGIETQIVSNASSYGPPPSWSPDGSRIAYLASRNGVQGVYGKAANGAGSEQLLYPSVSNVFNWSKDGHFLAITTGTNFAVLPIGGDLKPVAIMPTAGKLGMRLAPSNRLIAYVSEESGRNEVYVRAFDPSAAEGLGATVPRKVSTQGSPGLIRWNADGKELYYLSADGGVMVVSDALASAFDKQSSMLLFQVPDTFPLAGAPGVYSDISADGQRFVFALPVPDATEK